MSKIPKLSIVIPIYNAEKKLNKCINSIYLLKKKINLDNYVEIIAVDDGSTDRSKVILKKWQKKIKNIKIFQNLKNRGVSISRNNGMKYASGDYIFFLDADDYIISNNFLRFFTILKKKVIKDVFVFHNIVEGKNFLVKPKIKTKINKKFSECLFNTNSKFTNFNIWRCVLKRDYLIKNNIYFENIDHFEDWVFCAKLISFNPSFIEIKKYLYSYNYSIDNSLTKKTNKKYLYNTIFAYNYIKKLYQKNKKEKKIIKIMLSSLKKILFADLFLIKISKLNLFLKKYPFLLKIITLNINYRKLMKNNKKNFLIFCAGRIGRNLTLLIPKKKMNMFIIDNNNALLNKTINGYKIKNFKFFSKNIKNFLDCKIIIANFDKKDVFNISKKIIKKGIKRENILSIDYK